MNRLSPLIHLNTSYVLIYPLVTDVKLLYLQFKYILCSYLSTAVAVAGTVKSNLNTSYVLIYPNWNTRIILCNEFKYILCSYLSLFTYSKIQSLNKFKYILCSYLSGFQ